MLKKKNRREKKKLGSEARQKMLNSIHKENDLQNEPTNWAHPNKTVDSEKGLS